MGAIYLSFAINKVYIHGKKEGHLVLILKELIIFMKIPIFENPFMDHLTDSTNLLKIIQEVQPDESSFNLGAQSHVFGGFESPEYN